MSGEFVFPVDFGYDSVSLSPLNPLTWKKGNRSGVDVLKHQAPYEPNRPQNGNVTNIPAIRPDSSDNPLT